MPCWVGVAVVSMAATLRHITLNRTPTITANRPRQTQLNARREGATDRRIERNQLQRGLGPSVRGILQGPHFARQGVGVFQVGADLNQGLGTRQIPRQKSTSKPAAMLT